MLKKVISPFLLALILPNIAGANESKKFEITDYPPLPPQKKVDTNKFPMEYTKVQYEGGHGKDFIDQRLVKPRWYFAFNLNYSTFVEPDKTNIDSITYPNGVVVDSVDVAGSYAELTNPAYTGTMNTKGSMGFGVLFGRQFANLLKLEADINHQAVLITDFSKPSTLNQFSSGGKTYDEKGPEVLETHDIKLTTTSVMMNLLLQYPVGKHWAPFIGGGVGFSGVRANEGFEIENSYQIKAGIDYKITDRIGVYFLYKYFTIPDEVTYDLESTTMAANTGTGQTITQTDVIYKMRHNITYNVVEIGYRFLF